MNLPVFYECTAGSLNGDLSFPQVVAKLAQIKIARYCVDLTRMENIYYAANGEIQTVKFSLINTPEIPQKFYASDIQQAINDIQQGRIKYPKFLKKIMSFGATKYTVDIIEQQVIYAGHLGEEYSEAFLSTA
jgi:uncharacterized protein YbcV (DUF1398 family)